jgi:hypothetical protein
VHITVDESTIMPNFKPQELVIDDPNKSMQKKYLLLKY